MSHLKLEELDDEERPDRKIWLNDEKMIEWSKWLKKFREEKYSGDSKEIEDPVQNDAAKALIAE